MVDLHPHGSLYFQRTDTWNTEWWDQSYGCTISLTCKCEDLQTDSTTDTFTPYGLVFCTGHSLLLRTHVLLSQHVRPWKQKGFLVNSFKTQFYINVHAWIMLYTWKRRHECFYKPHLSLFLHETLIEIYNRVIFEFIKCRLYGKKQRGRKIIFSGNFYYAI